MDCQHWIEEVSQADPVRFGDDPKEAAVTIETPGPTVLYDFNS